MSSEKKKTLDEAKRGQFSLERFQNSNADIAFYTGFPDYDTLCLCLKVLNPGSSGENIIYVNAETALKNPTRRKLILQDEFFMTLIRLRLGVFENHLAHLFNVSTSTVQRICCLHFQDQLYVSEDRQH